MLNKLRIFFSHRGGGIHKPKFRGLEVLRYIGPGFLITVGFIDPGNWGANLAAGADFGYSLLWMVTLSTFMLIVLQQNVAHLGIASGLCLSEASMKHMPKKIALPVLTSAIAASIATSLAEVLGAAIALRMLFGIPLPLGAVLTATVVVLLLTTRSYSRIENIIIGFVALIGFAFLFELSLVEVNWKEAGYSWITPSFPPGSMLVIMSVLGAVVMPHNLFLHSEVIQSRQWKIHDEKIIKKQLRYQLTDTLVSMSVGWAINSAMILLAAATFFAHSIPVLELEQAKDMLVPLLGSNSANIFAIALLFAGFASTITSSMAGGSIVAGIFGEPYDIKDSHTRLGIIGPLLIATVGVCFITDPLNGLIISQMLLSVQLPITMLSQLWLTSSPKVMGPFVNSIRMRNTLIVLTLVVAGLNVLLLLNMLGLYS